MSTNKPEQQNNPDDGTTTALEEERVAKEALKQERQRAASEAVQAVLDSYNCTIVPQISVEGRITITTVVIVARD